MSKLRLFFSSLMAMSLLSFPAWADGKKEQIMSLLAAGKIAEAKKLVDLDTASFWVLLCTFFISFGMINLSSSIAQSFVGKGGGNEVGKATQAMVSMVGGAIGGAAVASVVNARRYKEAKEKRSELNSRRAHESETYDPSNGGDSGDA